MAMAKLYYTLFFIIVFNLAGSSLGVGQKSVYDYGKEKTRDEAPKSNPPKKKSTSQILNPIQGSDVSPEFFANGTILLRQSEVGWLAVRKGSRYWPKEPSISANGSWKVKVFEGGPPGRFYLTLLAVDQKTNKKFKQWFKNAQETGQYPGILLKNGFRRLSEIPLTLVR